MYGTDFPKELYRNRRENLARAIRSQSGTGIAIIHFGMTRIFSIYAASQSLVLFLSLMFKKKILSPLFFVAPRILNEKSGMGFV
jgi:hypothetical protein